MTDQRWKILAAFAAVYVIWGSTYLAIKLVEESLPPFFMASTRFLIAGFILYAWTRLRGTPRESRQHWISAFIIGGLMLLGGHGAVVWTEQTVPSGLVSLLVGTVPLWIIFSDWLWHRHVPSPRVIAGLILGFSGVALLAGGFEGLGASSIDVVGAGIVVFGAFLWASGSFFSKSAKLPKSPFLSVSMQMIAGGALLLVASFIAGEWSHVRFDMISERSLISWLYLIIFGSIIAYTSYIWLLKTASLAKVSTYAYVNPIVAILLGYTIGHEPLTARNLIAATIILASVVIITTYNTPRTNKQNHPPPTNQE